MSDQDIQIKQLADALTRLVKFVPSTKDELDQWYAQARSLEEGDLLRGVPHFLRHYLIDADTRMKDEAYAELQGR
jgi:predicted Zn-dependent peptidase